jgi:hypothetical protein
MPITNRQYEARIDQIDHHIAEKYTRADLEKMINQDYI